MSQLIRFAHLSDWHATSLRRSGLAAFPGKRLSGYASWLLSRRRHHDPAILEAAIRDVRSQSLDHVLVTGDLTHVSLPAEFEVARLQLEALGPPERVFLVHGELDQSQALAGKLREQGIAHVLIAARGKQIALDSPP